MKWKKQVIHYLIAVLLYEVFTIICNILNYYMEEYRAWILGCWHFMTIFFWIATIIIWLLLLREIMK